MESQAKPIGCERCRFTGLVHDLILYRTVPCECITADWEKYYGTGGLVDARGCLLRHDCSRGDCGDTCPGVDVLDANSARRLPESY